ncbi:hypothetical protein QEJ31_01200 [Pigmentibacter sp. JX0631]|uniref:hypothetical protein n=1 Tax=Pigmentibacter sp. JX0631 TaxID=2976982 RepID=UPI0024689E7C|nr:hypothetical protein [Pigmentibacter sp. JX0631]WGL60220.1 hypothetical protein QEJ31_01200 [Pigmentibacter sp. JX0631]
MSSLKIVKKLISAIFLLFYPLICFGLENPAAQSPITQGDTFLLPPLRRVGLDIVETNLDKFRIYMRKQDRQLYGIPAFPFNESDIQKIFAEDIADEIKNTGRFWNLALNDFVKLLPLAGNPSNNLTKKIEDFKRRLELDYNLEAWIKPSVYFAPDQTLVRLVLKGAGVHSSVWAREDIMLEPQVSQDKIKVAFSQALARLINTIGHDGKVTYLRENLLTIDFGIERGVVRGDSLSVGYVLLTSFHPQSGEFLRSQRVTIHEIKVLESRQGSSLCQIIASDRLAFEQALKVLGTNDVTMLVWKKNQSGYKEGWREPYNPETAPILGAVESGFGNPIVEKEAPESLKSAIPPVVFEKETNFGAPLTKEELQKRNNKNITEKQGLPYKIAGKEENLPIANSEINSNKFKRAIINKPGTWFPYTALLGTGIVIGASNGYISDFPKTILNKLSGASYINLDSEIQLKLLPYAQYSYFQNSTLSGSSYYAGAAFLDTIVNIDRYDYLSIGASAEYTGGQIDYSCDCRDSNVLSHPAVMANVMWEDNVASFGNYNLLAGLSVLDFVQQSSVWSIKANIRPYNQLPKELVFDIGIKRFYSGWIEFSIGVSWDFIPEYNYIRTIL